MTQQVARLKLPVAVVLREELQSVAAAAEDTVWIRPGVWLSRREARRIVVHELLGHVLPRLSARSISLGLLRVGSARGADDEEGRALLLERRHGLFGRVRQAELYDRHLAALSVTEGAEWVDTARLLVERGSSSERAVRIACRVHRGGGLARELVYLPALARVEQALDAEPELEAWLGSGRLSVDAARTLNRLYPCLLGAHAGSGLGSILDFHD